MKRSDGRLTLELESDGGYSGGHRAGQGHADCGRVCRGNRSCRGARARQVGIEAGRLDRRQRRDSRGRPGSITIRTSSLCTRATATKRLFLACRKSMPLSGSWTACSNYVAREAKYPPRSARADHRWIPPLAETPREKLEAWLRYYDDLNLGEFFVDRRIMGKRFRRTAGGAGRNKLRLRRHLGQRQR